MRRKNHGILSAVFLALFLTVISGFLFSGRAWAETGMTGLANPFRSCVNIAEAEAYAGFSLELPKDLTETGEWQEDSSGWWYRHADGTWPSDTWKWIRGKCYYFDASGYCVTGTTTPDGYTVNEKGEWTINGTPAKNAASEYVGTGIQSIPGNLIQARYSDGTHEIMIRKAAGEGDISGDYNVYPSDETVEYDGRTIAIRGCNTKVNVITWTEDGFSYAIDAESGKTGLGREFILSMIPFIR